MMTGLSHSNETRAAFALGAGECGGQFHVRQLAPEDWRALRDLRLEALLNDGDFLGPNYADEARLTEDQWRERCMPASGKSVFGLFDGGKMIGMVSARPWDEDAKGHTILWGQTYLQPAYRGRKLAADLYKARLAWSRGQPPFEQAVFFIHEDNVRSRQIHEKNGAVRTGSKPMFWPGRPLSNWHWYKIDLAA